ncbi:hypothetical protein [Streptomyces sp. MMG1121]|uniref:hypothetical protein n=1 Tax=Streptomyces sp. MMG1121 TaxID=1415544 RepID=UPI000B25356A|nr:hypothetical protein [Streptomyces sp. MMG1121]
MIVLFASSTTQSGITAAAVLTPIAAATPAAAYGGWAGCDNYVQDHGYVVGPKVQDACQNRAVYVEWWIPNPNCVNGLYGIGVNYGVAQQACTRAHPGA